MKKIGIGFSYFCAAVVGIGSIIWGGYLIGQDMGDAVWAFVVFYVFFVLSIYLIFALHEFGHAFFGYLTGYDLVAFGVGNFLLARQNGRWRLKRTVLLKGAAAQYIGVKKDEQDQRFFLMWAGGLIVHFILFLGALLFGVLTQQWGFAIIWMGGNAALLIVNAIPQGMSDGARIWELHRHPNHIPFMYQQLRHAAQTAVAPNEADLVDFRLLLTEDTGSIVDTSNLNHIETLIFESRLEEAERELKSFLERVDNSFSIQLGMTCLLLVYLLQDQLDQAEELAQNKGVKAILSMKMSNYQAIHALYQWKVKKDRKATQKAIGIGLKQLEVSRLLRDEKAYYRALLERMEVEWRDLVD